MTTYDVVVIGAGHNGLVCACYLAAKGLKVSFPVEVRVTAGAVAGRVRLLGAVEDLVIQEAFDVVADVGQ